MSHLFRSVSMTLLLCVPEAQAWVFSEHVEITRRALSDVERSGSATEQAMLSRVRTALHLCAEAPAPRCPTLATLPALAGDHSCWPQALRGMLIEAGRDPEQRVQRVLSVAAQTHDDLWAADRDASAREDIRRQMHVDLQQADPEYLANALVDYSHFQMTRAAGSRADLTHYLGDALAPAARANSTAAYVNYHVVAVRLAAKARTAGAPEEYVEWLTRAVLAEAFAAHFLQDSFATGHFVGHWGDAATRLGTHDFYSRVGVEAARWSAPTDTFVAHGDAFLTDSEASAVALAVRASLAQVLGAAADQRLSDALLAEFGAAFAEEEYDTCARADVPAGLTALSRSQAIQAIVAREPVPAVRSPALARVRAEKGLFLGGAATAAASYTFATEAPATAIRGALRAGVGVSGIIDDPLNAQAFIEAGFVGQYLSQPSGGASVTGFAFRIRAPGYLTLVDGVLALTLANFLEARCPSCLSWAAAAAGGGFGKLWRSVPLFGSVSGQISAFRDISLNWFRNEPRAGQYRVEVLMPALTARSFLPIAGERLSQSTDFYVDLGPSLTFSSDRPDATWGLFASFAMATRVFP